ncbi:hypothetical protein, partial [Salmonella sp. s60368]|uniref:hypothetical protein n=1 Tax=Salmonella sp. s60368 TaxID=3159723 RepID=UPI00398065F5
MIPPIIAIIVAGLLLHLALTDDYIAPNPLVSLGFGSLSPAAVIKINLPQEGTAGLTSCVLLANLPQLILSFL